MPGVDDGRTDPAKRKRRIDARVPIIVGELAAPSGSHLYYFVYNETIISVYYNNRSSRSGLHSY